MASSIYHEKQMDGVALCGMHCLNNLLQAPHFGPGDLAQISKDLDDRERTIMFESGATAEALNFIAQDSINSDLETGFFNIQVLKLALQQRGYDLRPAECADMIECMDDPTNEMGFICHLDAHWFCIRFVELFWFNLNSYNVRPEIITEFYLSAFLGQIRAEGYSVFVCRGLNDFGAGANQRPASWRPLPVPRRPEGIGNDHSWHQIDYLLEINSSGNIANSSNSDNSSSSSSSSNQNDSWLQQCFRNLGSIWKGTGSSISSSSSSSRSSSRSSSSSSISSSSSSSSSSGSAASRRREIDSLSLVLSPVLSPVPVMGNDAVAVGTAVPVVGTCATEFTPTGEVHVGTSMEADWACIKCTLRNKGHTAACAICFEPRPCEREAGAGENENANDGASNDAKDNAKDGERWSRGKGNPHARADVDVGVGVAEGVADGTPGQLLIGTCSSAAVSVISPLGWTRHRDATSGRDFYHNSTTQQSQWETLVPPSLSPLPQQALTPPPPPPPAAAAAAAVAAAPASAPSPAAAPAAAQSSSLAVVGISRQLASLPGPLRIAAERFDAAASEAELAHALAQVTLLTLTPQTTCQSGQTGQTDQTDQTDQNGPGPVFDSEEMQRFRMTLIAIGMAKRRACPPDGSLRWTPAVKEAFQSAMVKLVTEIRSRSS